MKTVNADDYTTKPGDRDPLRAPSLERYSHYPSARNAVLDIQDELNCMPLHKLGAMLMQASEMQRSADQHDRDFGRILSQQVLLAMSPEYDELRHE